MKRPTLCYGQHFPSTRHVLAHCDKRGACVAVHLEPLRVPPCAEGFRARIARFRGSDAFTQRNRVGKNKGSVTMDRVETLKHLFESVRKDEISSDRLLRSLIELKASSVDGYQREKLGNAIEWAEIYFSPRRWKPWRDRETVKGFLLSDIQRAEIAEGTSKG